jgi:DNA-binding response OmpR family regulator
MICPCCGQALNNRASLESLASAPLAKLEHRIIDAMVRAYPRSVTRAGLVDVLYFDDPDGGPDSAENIVAVMMVRLRKKLPPYGWTIPNCRSGSGNYGRYKLEPLP